MRISDWSSDVCSSDLEHSAAIRYLPAESAAAGAKSDTVSVPATVVTAPLTAPADIKIVTPAPDAARVMPPPPGTPVAVTVPNPVEIGRASRRERVCQCG